MLVNTKYANIFNIAANEEVIPELLQSKCNPKTIFKTVSELIEDPKKVESQLKKTQLILNNFKTQTAPSEKVAIILNKLIN